MTTLIVIIIIFLSVLSTPLTLKKLIDRLPVRDVMPEAGGNNMQKQKPKTGQTWVKHEDVLVEKMPTWEQRRIMAHGEDMMLVENYFTTGDTAPEHTHHHTQITYVIHGALEFTVDGDTRVLRDGDSVYIKPYAVHEAVALEDSLIIDMFAPMREDFLNTEKQQ